MFTHYKRYRRQTSLQEIWLGTRKQSALRKSYFNISNEFCKSLVKKKKKESQTIPFIHIIQFL